MSYMYLAISIPTFILGILIWKFQLVDIIAGYDEEKCTDKKGLARWVGCSLVLMSLLLAGLFILFSNIDESENVRVFSLIGVVLIIVPIIVLGAKRYEKK